MPNFPVPATKEELLGILDDMRARVESGDSFEGSVEYLMPEPGDPPEAQFRVRAAWRVGNTMGQGGMRMVGSLEPQLPSEEDARRALDGENPPE